MAYTSAPELNAQKNVYVAAVTEGKATQNTNLLQTYTSNFIIVDSEQGPVLQTRPQFTLLGSPFWGGALSSNITGTYVERNFVFFSSFDGANTRVQVRNMTTTLVSTLATVSGDHPVYFETFTNIAGQDIVIWVIGAANKGGYNLSTLTNTVITTAVIPNTVGAPVFLDGFLFWARQGTNEIYQSNFDDPFNYTAGNFITANIESGIIVNMGKIKNYLVVFKTSGTEFFYNAGNPSGSVLARNDSFFSSINIRGSRYFEYQDSLFFYGGDFYNSRQGLYQLSSSGQMQLYINPLWDSALPLTFEGYAAWGLVETNGTTLLVCHTTTVSSTRVTYGPCWWFDIGRKIFLQQSISPCFPLPDSKHVIFNSNSGQVATMFPDRAGPELVGIVTVPFVATYQLGNVTHDTLNFKTCNQIKVKLTTSDIPEILELQYNDAGTDSGTITRTIYASPLNVQSNRKDIIIRRVGRYRERNYRFAFVTNIDANAPSYRLNGFEFNITIGTH